MAQGRRNEKEIWGYLIKGERRKKNERYTYTPYIY
jgi:hypothetical protein